MWVVIILGQLSYHVSSTFSHQDTVSTYYLNLSPKAFITLSSKKTLQRCFTLYRFRKAHWVPSLLSLASSGQVEPGHKKGWGEDWRPEVTLP